MQGVKGKVTFEILKPLDHLQPAVEREKKADAGACVYVGASYHLGRPMDKVFYLQVSFFYSLCHALRVSLVGGLCRRRKAARNACNTNFVVLVPLHFWIHFY